MVDSSHTTQSRHDSSQEKLRQRIALLSPAQQQLFRQQLAAKGIVWDHVATTKNEAAQTKDLPVSCPEKLPLSASQKHLWVLHQLDPNTTAYHIALVLTINGALKLAALHHSLQSIVNRHESLRTVFLQENNRPYTKVLSQVELNLPIVDFSQKTDLVTELTRQKKEISQALFDLEKGPLIRAELIKTAENTFELVLVLHHLIADGWSRGIFLKELATNYRNQVQASSNQLLPDLKIQYPDYVLQQAQWLKSETCQHQKAYWQQQLKDLPELDLLTDGVAGTDFSSQTCTRFFSVEETKAIKAIAVQSKASVFMMLLAIFKLLLHRYSGQTDIAVGVPVAGRNTAAVEPLIGFFVNTLVLRSRLDAQAPFSDWLAQVQATLADALQHQDIPFSEVVDAVGVARSPGKNPLFRVMFQVQSNGYQPQNAEQLDLGMPGLALTQQWIEPQETKFDMSWHVIERDGRLLVAVEYRTECFKPDRIERMLGHFHTLVNAVVDNPAQKAAQISLLSASEKERLLSWGQGKPADPTLYFPARFEQQVKETPEAIAVSHYAGHYADNPAQQVSLTYRQLNQRANKLAHWLHSKGIGPNTLVGICLHPGIDLMTALLAVLKAGGAYLPLDPTLPAERLRYMLKDAKPVAMIGHRDCLEPLLIKESAAHAFYLDTEEQQLISQPGHNLTTVIEPTNLAYIIYTSGSTGNPKGTQLTHGGLINYLNWCLAAYPVSEGCGAPVQSSIGFDATITSVFSPLLAGKQVAFGLGENEIEALQASLLQGFSFIKITPAHLSALQPLLKTQKLQRQLLPKAFIIGGEALQAQHIETWREQYPEVALFNEYGPTEAVVGCCVHQVTAQDSGNIPIGRPINDVQLYILDENRQVVPAGIPGELYIGGAGVAQGYLNQPELTAERFVSGLRLDSALGARRLALYKTGDRATYNTDGTIQYLGRIDSQIKLRGFRIEPGEIEATLCEHKQVEQSVVVLSEQNNSRELLAYITTPAMPEIEIPKLSEELQQWLSHKLPSYMVPSHIIRIEALPLTINGKVDCDALPAPSGEVEGTEATQPRDRKEQILLDIWQQILDRKSISVYDNFFDLGGDSISGMQIVSKAHEQGLQLTPSQLFEHQTIAEQAAVAKALTANSFSEAPPMGSISLSPIQQAFFKKNLSSPHHYNQAVMLAVKSTVEASALQAALDCLIQHHDSLRLRFKSVSDQWEQYYALPETVSVPIDELNFTDRQEQFDEAIAALQASLDLTNGPLLKSVLLTVDSDKYLLLIAHHLLVDGVSWRILLDDLLTAYRQIVTHQKVDLSQKTTAFGYWTKHLKEQSFELERPYWEKACAPTPPLPIDRPLGRNTVADEREIVVCLSEKETAALKTFSLSVNVILLSALAQTLKQWNQSSTIVLDMEGHGRQVWDESLNLARTVGWFTSLYPLRLTLSSGSFTKQLSQVQQQLSQVPNEGVGFGALQSVAEEALPGQQSLASPAEISFNYLGQLAIDTTGFVSRLVTEPVPGTKSSAGDRAYIFEIVALIQSRQLQIRWRYSQEQYEQITMQQLSQRFSSNLKSLIAHCRQPSRETIAPASLSAAGVEAGQLNRLMNKLQSRGGRTS